MAEKDQVKLVPYDKIEMLGVPLGSKDFTSDYVKEDLLTRLMPMLERLEAFEDTQAALYLLRVSFSIVRATHYMRTTPLDQWKEHGGEDDGTRAQAVEPHSQTGRVGLSPHSRPRKLCLQCELA